MIGTKILGILELLTRYVVDDPEMLVNEQVIYEHLVAQGFSPLEIEAAFAWLERRMALDEARRAVADGGSPQAWRVLTREEEWRLTPEALGFLLRLEGLGLIGPAIREEVIEKAMAVDVEEVGLDEIRAITALILAAHDRVGRVEVVHALQGEWDQIYH